MDYREEIYLKLNQQADTIIGGLPQFARKYFTHIKNLGMSPRTRLQYAYDMSRFFEYLATSEKFSGKEISKLSASEILDELNIDDIQEYISSLEYYTATDPSGKEVTRISSPSIRARRISCLRSFYKYYFKIGDIKNNLSDLMDVPKIPEKQIVVMNKDQVQRILAAVKDVEGLSEQELKRHAKIVPRDFAIMMLFFGTGIRVSELVGIDITDIDFYQASILVTRKGGDQDEVYFGPEVEEALQDYNEGYRDILLGGRIDEKAFFISMQHKRMSVRSVELMIKNYAKKAGLNTKVTPHALRRTFGTNLYEETGDIYLVADALHHSSVETTKKHYAKMSKDHKRIAASKSSTLFTD